MKYFLDTEFIEGWKKPISWLPTIGNFNKKYHSVQLISVGIVAEDGRKYYAVSNEFNPRDASDWVKENVLLPIYLECVHGDMRNYAQFNIRKNSDVTWGLGKSNKQIAEEIKQFTLVNPHSRNQYENGFSNGSKPDIGYDLKWSMENRDPEFYAYYADYDWVVFCSLFGTMMNLPKGFPMYCKDLKQMLDDKVSDFGNTHLMKFEFAGNKMEMKDVMTNDFNSKLSAVKNMKDYPKQENEHNALDDAKWNQRLFNFIKSL